MRMLHRVVLLFTFVIALSLPIAAFAQEGGGAQGGGGTGTGTGAEGGGASAATASCTLYGCNPNVGNPIQELAGMIVTCGAVAVVLGGVTRRVIG